MATSRVKNSAQVSSCQLKFVNNYSPKLDHALYACPTQFFQHAQAQFSTAVSYTRKMFMTPTPGPPWPRRKGSSACRKGGRLKKIMQKKKNYRKNFHEYQMNLPGPKVIKLFTTVIYECS